MVKRYRLLLLNTRKARNILNQKQTELYDFEKVKIITKGELFSNSKERDHSGFEHFMMNF